MSTEYKLCSHPSSCPHSCANECTTTPHTHWLSWTVFVLEQRMCYEKWLYTEPYFSIMTVCCGKPCALPVLCTIRAWMSKMATHLCTPVICWATVNTTCNVQNWSVMYCLIAFFHYCICCRWTFRLKSRGKDMYLFVHRNDTIFFMWLS